MADSAFTNSTRPPAQRAEEVATLAVASASQSMGLTGDGLAELKTAVTRAYLETAGNTTRVAAAEPVTVVLVYAKADSTNDTRFDVKVVDGASSQPGAFTSTETWADGLGRYTPICPLGRGGMGEVFRVRDSYLNRNVAMKILHLPGEAVRERFLEEAQVTAQLQHPAIIPVYDVGVLVDGRPYFTMKEIVGRTFGAVIAEAHLDWEMESQARAGELGSHGAQSAGKWSLQRLIGDFQRLCGGVGYAHKLGVLHRDLKPSNMMIGDFGEVLVVDWGLTRVSAAAAGETDYATGAPVSDRSHSEESSTQFGTVLGTPGYMAPEQAAGDITQLGPHSDVYSLGAVLYAILSSHPPDGYGLKPPTPLGKRANAEANGWEIPVDLKTICERAMAWEPAHRYSKAGELSEVLAAWLEGAQRRDRALGVLAQARELKPKIADDLRRSSELEAEAAAKLDGIPPFAPIEAKKPGWVLQDEAANLRNRSQLNEVYYTQLVRAALTHAGDLEAANEMLAEYYYEQHKKAEGSRDTNAAAQFEILLRDYGHQRYAAYLQGDGGLSLHCEPPGAAAALFRYEEGERRLFPVLAAELGHTPLDQYSLPMGSYLVRISHPKRIDVDYPVFIERQQCWDGVRPGSSGSYPIYLPEIGELGQEDCYVPAGWFWSGGDAQARNGLGARRYWLDAFIMRRFHVTVGEYLEFLNDLVAQSREDEAAQHVPPAYEWEKIDKTSSLKDANVVLDASGKYVFTGSEDKLRWPQIAVNWAGAKAYCDWLSIRDGLEWRLPTEIEHEKAARGVDCRCFPWGNFLDPTFCAMRLSHSGIRAVRATVDEYPVNVSPYGVRGLSGNVYSWCEDAFSPTGPTVENDIPRPPDPSQLKGPGAGGGHRVVRGGSWRDPEWNCRAAHRDSPPAHLRDSTLGFRIVRSFPLSQ